MAKAAFVILTGTDPQSSAGGIGTVLPGYLEAMRSARINHTSIPTYHPKAQGGKTVLWIKSLPRIIALARQMRGTSKVVVHSHAGAGISLVREAIVLSVARAAGVRTILQIHTCQLLSYLQNGMKRLFLTAAIRPAHKIVVLTPWWKDRLAESGFGHVHVIPNPMPPSMYEVALERVQNPREKKNNGVIQVLSMSRLVKGKGVETVIRALSKLDGRVALTIAGDGPEKRTLETMSHELGLRERITFTGWADEQKKRELLDKADIFCLPSTFDVFPMSFLEAMAYGLPVVGVHWGGIPDVVKDGVTGILVREKDETSIANALEQLFDDSKRHVMGQMGLEQILDISSPSNVGKQLKELFETV
jgi:glycosyltransferase involved in cell wall biosynthesis